MIFMEHSVLQLWLFITVTHIVILKLTTKNCPKQVIKAKRKLSKSAIHWKCSTPWVGDCNFSVLLNHLYLAFQIKFKKIS